MQLPLDAVEALREVLVTLDSSLLASATPQVGVSVFSSGRLALAVGVFLVRVGRFASVALVGLTGGAAVFTVAVSWRRAVGRGRLGDFAPVFLFPCFGALIGLFSCWRQRVSQRQVEHIHGCGDRQLCSGTKVVEIWDFLEVLTWGGCFG